MMAYISECKPIDVPIGRRLLSNVSTVGSSANLVCDAGFVPDTTVVTCTANGTWSPRPSSCGIMNLLLTFFYFIPLSPEITHCVICCCF